MKKISLTGNQTGVFQLPSQALYPLSYSHMVTQDVKNIYLTLECHNYAADLGPVFGRHLFERFLGTQSNLAGNPKTLPSQTFPFPCLVAFPRFNLSISWLLVLRPKMDSAKTLESFPLFKWKKKLEANWISAMSLFLWLTAFNLSLVGWRNSREAYGIAN